MLLALAQQGPGILFYKIALILGKDNFFCSFVLPSVEITCKMGVPPGSSGEGIHAPQLMHTPCKDQGFARCKFFAVNLPKFLFLFLFF